MQVDGSLYVKYGEKVNSIFIFSFLVTSIAGFYILVWYNQEKVETKEFKDRFGNLHVGIHLKRNKYNMYYFPNFLLRRFIFFFIPIVLIHHPAQQL